VIGFVDGTVVHVEQLTRGGIHAYAGFGYAPVQVFLVLLVVLDPVAVLLCTFARRTGIWLGVLIMALDVPANWAGNWNAMPRYLVTFWPGELFAAFVFATALPLLRALGVITSTQKRASCALSRARARRSRHACAAAAD
jgi:hypothetical protein